MAPSFPESIVYSGLSSRSAGIDFDRETVLSNSIVFTILNKQIFRFLSIHLLGVAPFIFLYGNTFYLFN